MSPFLLFYIVQSNGKYLWLPILLTIRWNYLVMIFFLSVVLQLFRDLRWSRMEFSYSENGGENEENRHNYT